MAARDDVKMRLIVEDILSAKYKQIHSEIQRANKATQVSNKNLAKGSQEASKKITGGMEKAKKAAKEFSASIGSALRRFGPAAVAVGILTVGITSLGTSIEFVTEKTEEFEKTLSTVKAILKPSTREFKLLSNEAQRLGETTAFSATQSGDAFVALGKLGLTTNQILASTGDVLNIAAAANIDLARAAELTAITMKQFGLDAEDAQRITDVMAKSFTTSALDAEKFGESMKFAGPTAAQLGISLEKTAGAMAQLANAGISGSMAGTAMRRVMLELGDSSGKVAKIIGKAKFATLDFNEKLLELQRKGLSPTQIKRVFGLLASTSAGVLIQGAKNVQAFGKSFEDAQGAAKAMADTMLDNVAGATVILESAQEGLALAIGSAFGQDKRTRIELYTETIQNATKFVKDHQVEIKKLSSIISTVLTGSFNIATETVGAFANGLARVNRIIDLIRGGAEKQAKEMDRFNESLGSSESVDRLLELRRRFDEIQESGKGVVETTNIFGNTISRINPELEKINERTKALLGFTFQEAAGQAVSLKLLEDRSEALKSVLKAQKEIASFETLTSAADIGGEDFVFPTKAKKAKKIPGSRTVDFQKAKQDAIAASEKLAEIAKKTNADLQLELLSGKEKELEILRRFQEEKESLLAAGGESAAVLDQVIADRRTAILEAELQKRKDLILAAGQIALSGASNLASALGNLSAVRNANEVKSAEAAGKSEEDINRIRKAGFEKQKKFSLSVAVLNIAQGVTAAFSKGLPLGAIEAAFISAAGAVQISAINAQQFRDGGIVPGSSFQGDNVLARVNSGEAILNTAQQRRFLDLANGKPKATGGGVGSGTVITFEAPIINVANGDPEVIKRAVDETYQEMINNLALATRDSNVHELV